MRLRKHWLERRTDDAEDAGVRRRETIAEYLTEALATDDAAFIAQAISTVARAQGMGAVAESAGVDRANLYRALRGGTKPEFETIRKVLAALGVQLVVKPRAA